MRRAFCASIPHGTICLIGLFGIFAYLSLPIAKGGCAFAGETSVPPQLVPSAPGPPPPLEEEILAPVPSQFEWMRREVRPNRPLEALLGLREARHGLLMTTSLSQDYSDNFFQREHGRQAGYPTSVGIGTVYRLERGRSFVSLANSLSAYYEPRSGENAFGFTNLSLNAGHRLPRLSLALSESLIRSDDVANATPQGIRRGRRSFLQNSITPQVRYDLTRTSAVNLAYTNIVVHNEDGRRGDTDTLILEENEGDSISHAFTTGLQHWFSRAFSSNVSYTFSTTDNTRAADTRAHSPSVELDYIFGRHTSTSLQAFGTITERSDGGENSDFYGVSVGVRQQLPPLFSAFVSIGPTVFDRESRGPRVFANWQASLNGTFTSRTSLTLSGQQGVTTTVGAVEDVGTILSRSVALTLNHRLSRNLFTAFFVNYTRTEFLEDVGTGEMVQSQKVDYWSGGVTASYALTQLLTLSGGYRHQRSDSNLAGNSFDENRLTVALSASFRLF